MSEWRGVKWEYRRVYLAHHIGIEWLDDKYGSEGWELVSVSERHGYFKRPVMEEFERTVFYNAEDREAYMREEVLDAYDAAIENLIETEGG